MRLSKVKNYFVTTLIGFFFSFHLFSQCTGEAVISGTDPVLTFSAINYPSGYNTTWEVSAYPNSFTNYSSTFTHTFEYNGVYPVRLTITNPGVCQIYIDTFIIITNAKSCKAFFSETITNGNNWERTYTPTFSKPGLSYLWDFGDSTTSTLENPTHVYSHGIYYPTICLTVTDTNLSSDTICKMVWGYDLPVISGTISAGGNVVDSAHVYLIGFDTTAGAILYIDSVRTNTMGEYTFWDTPYFTKCLNYYILASLPSSSTSFSDYSPSYYFGISSSLDYVGKIDWNDAFSSLCNNSSFHEVNIDLVKCQNPGSSASISGTVTKQNIPGEPVLIIARNEYDEPVGYTYSLSNGNFSLANLPFGNYSLHPEVTRKTTTPVYFNLSASKPSINSFTVEVNTTTVTVSMITGIENTPPFNETKLYPNPVKNSLNINFGKEVSSKTTIEVLDISGRIIISQNFESGNKAIIDTAPLSQGTYLLKLSSQDGSQVFQFVK